MSFRAVASLALLLLALAAERCGYYGTRSVLGLDLTQHHGFTGMESLNLFRLITFVAYGCAFAGGGLAFAFGPRVTATIGAFLAAIGAFALAAGAPVTPFALVLAIGAGIFKACPYAAAAEILADEDGGAAQGFLPTPRRFASVATFIVLAYGAVNLGGFIAPLIAGVLRETRDGGGFTTTYAFAGALDLIAAILAGITIFLGSDAAKNLAQAAHAPYGGGEPPVAASAAPLTASTKDVFVPLSLIGIAFAAMHFVMEHAQPDPVALGLPSAAWIFSINPIIVLLMIVPCGALFFVLAIQRSAIPLTRILGGGMAVFALGGLLGALALFIYAGLALWAPALVIMAIGEAIAFPIGLTYAALVKRSRAATMVVAGWVTLTALPNFYFGLSSFRERLPWTEAIIVTLGALVALGGAIFVLVKAAQLHRDLAGHSNATS